MTKKIKTPASLALDLIEVAEQAIERHSRDTPIALWFDLYFGYAAAMIAVTTKTTLTMCDQHFQEIFA